MTAHHPLDPAAVSSRLRGDVSAPPQDPGAWLLELCRWLLRDVSLVVAGEPHRLLEVEAYAHADWHADPFAHRDPSQVEHDTWYLHRSGGTLRAGTYKGLDLTFGPSSCFGGLLFRALETPDGRIVEGPSLLVDHVIRVLDVDAVSELWSAISTQRASDPHNPLHLRRRSEPLTSPVRTSARVGLTLKRAERHPTMPAWLLRRYRATTAPSRLRKARVHQVVAAHQDGLGVDEIRQRTGAREHTIRRWLARYEVGAAHGEVGRWIGTGISAREWPEVHGAWAVTFGDTEDIG